MPQPFSSLYVSGESIFMTRRELREHVFCILFTCDFYRPSQEDIKEQTELYFTHMAGDGLDYPPEKVAEEDRREIVERVNAITEKMTEIDRMLDETSVGWTTGRMSRTDLTILRIGVYEMLFDEKIPTGVAINESVLLAKKFGGEDSSSFVNGILAKLDRIKGAEKKEDAR